MSFGQKSLKKYWNILAAVMFFVKNKITIVISFFKFLRFPWTIYKWNNNAMNAFC